MTKFDRLTRYVFAAFAISVFITSGCLVILSIVTWLFFLGVPHGIIILTAVWPAVVNFAVIRSFMPTLREFVGETK